MAASRVEYSGHDDQKMCQFLLSELRKNNCDAFYPCGNKIWSLALKKKLFTQHTVQSLRDHMRRVILPNLEKMPIPKKDRESLRRNFSKTKKMPPAAIKTKHKPPEELKRFLEVTLDEETDDGEENDENIRNDDELDENDYQVIIEEEDNAALHVPDDAKGSVSDDESSSLIARVVAFTKTLQKETNPKEVQIENSSFQNPDKAEYLTAEEDKHEENMEQDEKLDCSSKLDAADKDFELETKEEEPVEEEEVDRSTKPDLGSDLNILVPESIPPHPVSFFGETQGFDVNVVSDSETEQNINKALDIEEKSASDLDFNKSDVKMFLLATETDTRDEASLLIALKNGRSLMEIGKKYKMNFKDLIAMYQKFKNLRDLEISILMQKNFEDFLDENFV